MIANWKEFINEELTKDYMKSLQVYIKKERETKVVYPASSEVLTCFNLCDYYQTKVVIIGTEPNPYDSHNHGLAYSTLASVTPPQLTKIFSEIRRTIYPEWEKRNREIHKTNDLSAWARQGVLLLNILMTSEKDKRGAHKNKGWEQFLTNTIQELNKHPYSLVFMLWGINAKNYAKFIDKKHYILEAEHPLAAQGFEGCQHFLKANEFINKKYFNVRSTINWHLL